MKVYIGADHNGFHMKGELLKHLQSSGHEVVDEGDRQPDANDDFPIYAQKVVNGILASDDKDARGILLCGSGQGMCMSANRYKGIRALLGYDNESVRSARNDDDANVLCLPANRLDSHSVKQLADSFLGTDFAAAPRFVRRIKEMDNF